MKQCLVIFEFSSLISKFVHTETSAYKRYQTSKSVTKDSTLKLCRRVLLYKKSKSNTLKDSIITAEALPQKNHVTFNLTIFVFGNHMFKNHYPCTKQSGTICSFCRLFFKPRCACWV